MAGILIIEMIAGGLGVANRSQVGAYVEQDLSQNGLSLYGATGQQGLTSAWDRMQNFVSPTRILKTALCKLMHS